MGAGLTPKMKDMDTRAQMLPYAAGKPDLVEVEKDTDTDNRGVFQEIGMGRCIATDRMPSFGGATTSKLYSSVSESGGLLVADFLSFFCRNIM